ncbi:uncharacterized protein TM35_000211950 [Trypanosoma theileri]|uniref:Pleckstrin homology domain-containing protein n=1 Tax=Trypanosoma theileri TaxID=67003 RepID=A0A1X0NTT5_9TRYP|nr:uncharacterized protein TM35_000211950 [Trypanosoma theileri]ORC87589.1 hypothetical protein TM35_000211950 [Trypanosoma theileri]
MSALTYQSKRRVLAPPILNPYEDVEAKEDYTPYQQHPRKEQTRNAREYHTVPSSSYQSQYENPESGVYHELDDDNDNNNNNNNNINNNESISLYNTLPPPLPPPSVLPVSTNTPHSNTNIQQSKQQQQQSKQQLHSREVYRKGASPPRHEPIEATSHPRRAQPQAPRTRGPNSTTVIIEVEADQVTNSTSKPSEVDFSCRETQLPHTDRLTKQSYRSSSSRRPSNSNRTSLRDDDLYSGGGTRDRRRSSSSSTAAEVETQEYAQAERKQQQQQSQRQSQQQGQYQQQQSQQQQQQLDSKFVIQSAFTQQNPFRRQTFEEFCCFPDYSAPSTFSTYKPELNGWSGFQRAAEGGFHNQFTKEALLQGNSNRSTVYPIPPAALAVLQAGDWFLKWTRRGKVHERFVWLDTQRDIIVWGQNPRYAFVLLSHLKLNDVVDVRPDCLFDESTQRTFYRLSFVTEERTIVFATEMRDKFDFWFNALQKIISTGRSSAKWSGLWGSVESQAAAKVTSASDWASRSSPLHAVLHGYVTSSNSAGAGAMLTHMRGQVLPSD